MLGQKIEVRCSEKKSKVHVCWRAWCSPWLCFAIHKVRVGCDVSNGLWPGSMLLRIIVITVFSPVNPMFLSPHLLPSVCSNRWIFLCNHSIFCFPSKIPSCPSLSLVFTSSMFPMKSLPSFAFHNQPFQFPTSHFFLVLGSFLISWTLLFLVPYIFFPLDLSFLSFLLVLFSSHVQAFQAASLPLHSWCRWWAEEMWQLPRMWSGPHRLCKWWWWITPNSSVLTLIAPGSHCRHGHLQKCLGSVFPKPASVETAGTLHAFWEIRLWWCYWQVVYFWDEHFVFPIL